MPRKRKQTPDDYNKAFPTTLRKLMTERNIKQKELADYLGITRQSISYYCDGSSSPDWETVANIATFFSVPSDFLLGLTEDPSMVKSAVDELGLSPKSVKWIKSLDGKAIYVDGDDRISLFNFLLQSYDFQEFFHQLCEYYYACVANTVFNSIVDENALDVVSIREQFQELTNLLDTIEQRDLLPLAEVDYLRAEIDLWSENESPLVNIFLNSLNPSSSEIPAMRSNGFYHKVMQYIKQAADKEGKQYYSKIKKDQTENPEYWGDIDG